MSTMQDSQPINIHISTKEHQEKQERKTNEYNEFKNYIIVNNVVLQEEIKEANIKIKDLESEVRNKEELEDKYDTRIMYLKGLLNNLNELRNEYTNISNKSEEKVKIVQDLHKKNKKNYYEICLLLITINILTIFTPIYYTDLLILCFQATSLSIIIYCYYKVQEKYKSITFESKEVTINFKNLTTQINSIKNEIKKTEDACISLDNWIAET